MKTWLPYLVCVLISYISIFPLMVSAMEYDVPDNIIETRVVGEDEWDSYQLYAEDKQVVINVKAISAGAVDFYLMTNPQYKDYKDIFAVRFGYVEKSENAATFSWAKSGVDYVFIIDNAEITNTGAVPVGNVTYEISIKYSDKGFFDSNTCGVSNQFCTLCGAFILLAIITTSWLYRAPKQYREKAEQLKVLKKKV